eukprot:4916935-Pyramimonas_sp.AAC.1
MCDPSALRGNAHAQQRGGGRATDSGTEGSADSHIHKGGGRARASRVYSVRHENIPALHASTWSIMRIYPRFMRLIGPS